MPNIHRHRVVIVPEMDNEPEDYIVVEELNMVFISPRLLHELTRPDKDAGSLALTA
jgi:hypothetical protein